MNLDIPKSDDHPINNRYCTPFSDEPPKLSIMAEQEEDVESFPNLSDMPLHEWIAALTHPKTGRYPGGVTARTLDALAKRLHVKEFPGPDRTRTYPMWKTIPHLSVYLSEAARKGRASRICTGTYVGNFGDKKPKGQIMKKEKRNTPPPQDVLDVVHDVVNELGSMNLHMAPTQVTVRSLLNHAILGTPVPIRSTNDNIVENSSPNNRPSNKRKSAVPQRIPDAFNPTKRVCVSVPNSEDTPPQLEQQSARPPSCDSINGGSGSSTDDCPIDQQNRTIMVFRKTGMGMELVKKNIRKHSQTATATAMISINSTPLEIVKHPSPNSAASGGSEMKSIKMEKSMPALNLPHTTREDIDEFGLPSLLKVDPTLANVTLASLHAMTVQGVVSLCEKRGFEEEAKALLREEVDGTAFLLLTREDVTKNLGLKLGPALKLHRFIRTIQNYVKTPVLQKGQE